MELEFKLTREIPKSLNKGAIEKAVQAFVVEASLDVDPVGFYDQTLQKIASATYLNQPGQDFWLAHCYGEVAGYALASIGNDLDGRLCYWVSQAWANPSIRGKQFVKDSWSAIRQHAERNMCAHLLVISCRDVAAHCRWLRGNMQPYATILKQDLGAAIPEGVKNGLYARSN